MESAILLTGVSKSYRLYQRNSDRLREALHPLKKQYHNSFFALKNVSLDVARGEILGIVGKNGSGKSTLLKLISRVLVPNEGEVRVNGKVTALLELGSGFNPEFSGLQNIHFYGNILGLSKAEIESKLKAIVSFADIGEFLYQPLKTYSSGMKSRLGFAVAVHVDPEILILDEVLAVGDDVFKRKCFAKMEEFFKSGKTIIYVSHDSNSVNQLCSRAIFLDEGKVIMDGKPKIVTAYYQKYIFSNVDDIAGLTEEIEDFGQPEGRDSRQAEVYRPRFLDKLVSKSKMEHRNRDVAIVEERILDSEGRKVNVLDYGEHYIFEVEVRFAEQIRDVCFGLEIKDIRGVLVTSVESAQLFRMSKSVDQAYPGDVFRLRYAFPCLLCKGTYLVNVGVNRYADEQEILNRIVDLYMFKVDNDRQYSAGYVQMIGKMELERDGEPGSDVLLDSSELNWWNS